jgi:hypothetical protein
MNSISSTWGITAYLDAVTGDFVSSDTGSKASRRRRGRAEIAFFRGTGATHIMVNRAPLDDPRLGLSPDSRARFDDFLARFCEPVLEKGTYALFELRGQVCFGHPKGPKLRPDDPSKRPRPLPARISG